MVLVLAILLSCERRELVHIYSPDRDQCLTVITFGNHTQYLMEGETLKVPDSNFIKLDIREKDLVVDNSINICWEEYSAYNWDVVISSSMILEMNIDTNKFRFRTDLPLKDNLIPTEKKFRNKNCATIDLGLGRSSPPSETAVVIRAGGL